MSTVRNSRPVRATLAWLCATFSVGCTASQVRPISEVCPPETVQSMEELHLLDRLHSMSVVVDINQPGMPTQLGLYRQGPITSKVVRQPWSTNPLPEGTLLYGQLWIEGIIQQGWPAVMGRYTEALLPDGRRFPVCVVLGDPRTGMIGTSEPKDGTVALPREDIAFPVLAWP